MGIKAVRLAKLGQATLYDRLQKVLYSIAVCLAFWFHHQMKTTFDKGSPYSTMLSTKKSVREWRNIREELNAGASPEIWKTALNDYYFDRLNSRYLIPIQAILAHGNCIGEGFAVVAIQCSLIEFLESCYQGMNYVYNNPSPPHEYNKSKRMFVSFLTERDPLRQTFDVALAGDFYDRVRCGVLHEACTKGPWRIRAKSESSIIVDKTNHVLYRTDFQNAMLTFITNYIEAVSRTPDLQKAFIRKYDYLSK